MKRAFTLIETILYITLLSFVLLGIFSLINFYLYSSINKKKISDTDYQKLILNFHE